MADSTGTTLATFDYDDLGRRKTLTRGNNVVTNYTYDAVSRLASLTQDPAGSGYDNTVTLTYNPAGQITASDRSNAAYVYVLPASAVETYTSDGRNHYSNYTYAVNRYNIYGAPIATNQGRFQYTGQMWIAEISKYYYKARFYQPWAGRFMQTDPIGTAGGINLYGYVGNDPVNGRDPLRLKDPSCPSIVAGHAGNYPCEEVTVTGGCDEICKQVRLINSLAMSRLFSGLQEEGSILDATHDPLSQGELFLLYQTLSSADKDSALTVASKTNTFIGTISAVGEYSTPFIAAKGLSVGLDGSIALARITDFLHGIGVAGLGLGFVFNTFEYYYEPSRMSGTHLAVNGAITSAAIAVPEVVGLPAAVYFVVDDFYPGGAYGLMTDYGRTMMQFTQLNPYGIVTY